METVFGVILGTGVGGGVAIRGHTLVGANAIAGEWSHNPFPGRGPMRSQGRRAIAVGQAVSRLFFPALRLRQTIVVMADAT